MFAIFLFMLIATSVFTHAQQKIKTNNNINALSLDDEAETKEQIAQAHEFTLVCETGEKITIPAEHSCYLDIFADHTSDTSEIKIKDSIISFETLQKIKIF